MSFHSCDKAERNIAIVRWESDEWVKQTVITPLPSQQQSVQDATTYPPLSLFLKVGGYVTLKPGLTPFPTPWRYSPPNSKWDAGSARGGVESVKSCKSWLPPSSPASARSIKRREADVESKVDAKSYRSWLPPSTAASPKRIQKKKVDPEPYADAKSC